MPTSHRTQTLVRGVRQTAQTAKLVILSMFLPTKLLTEMADPGALAP